MAAKVFAVADAIGKDVEEKLAGEGKSYKKLTLDDKLFLYLTIAAERMAGSVGVSFENFKPYITDYIGFGASIYEHHHTMDIAKKASFLGLTGIELHSVDLGGASAPAALEMARRLCADEERLILIAGAEVPRGGPNSIAYYREVNDALLDEHTELHTQANLISLYALLADRLMFEHGITTDDVEAITRYFRGRVIGNERAAMGDRPLKAGELQRYLAGVYATAMVAVATDHGAAMFVANDKYLSRLENELGFNTEETALYINGGGTNFAEKHLTKRPDFSSPARVAAERAFSRAGIQPGEIDYAWIYDCFTLMLVRQAADYFNLLPNITAKTLRQGFIEIENKKIPVNHLGGILNTQAAISLSAATGLLDIFDFAAKNSDAQHFLYGGNGGIDCINSVVILSRTALEHKNTVPTSKKTAVPESKPIAAGERATLYAAVAVRFNPGSAVPFALGAFRREDGSVCLAQIHNTDLTQHLDISDLKSDATQVEFRLIENKPVAVLFQL